MRYNVEDAIKIMIWGGNGWGNTKWISLLIKWKSLHPICTPFSVLILILSFKLSVSQLFMQIDALYSKRFGTWSDYAKKYCNAHYRWV